MAQDELERGCRSSTIRFQWHMTVGFFVSTGAVAAVPIAPRPLDSAAIIRAEAGENVRSWYWQGREHIH